MARQAGGLLSGLRRRERVRKSHLLLLMFLLLIYNDNDPSQLDMIYGI